jgi:prepilin-type N-terminal cleavage/methylation domain-containing protein
MKQSARGDEMFAYVKTETGFSLVEVMIALVVLLLVFMGLMQAALLGIDSNLRNIFRDEALRIAAERMEEAKSLPFNNVVDDTADAVADTPVALAACTNPPVSDPAAYPVAVRRTFRSIVDFPYGTRRTVLDYGAAPVETKRITITVRWVYRGECYTHRIISLRRR